MTIEQSSVPVPRHLLLLGDLHLGRFSNDVQELAESVDYIRHEFMPLLQSYNEQYGCDNVGVVQLGDVFDNKTSVGVLTGNHVIDVFSELSSTNKVFILVGNHDTVYKEIRNINNSRSLSLLPNVTVVTALTAFNNNSIYMMPHYGNKDKLTDAVDSCAHNSILFGHDEIAGFMYEGKIIMDGESISATMFKKFRSVIFGHIHKSQSSHNIHYIGTPYQTRINEWHNTNIVASIDTVNNTIIKYPVRTAPKYVKIMLLDLLNMTVDQANTIVANNKVTVLCPNDTIITIPIHKITALLDGYKKLEYKQIYQATTTTIQDGNDTDEDYYSIDNDVIRQIEDYLHNIDSITVDKSTVALTDPIKSSLLTLITKLYNAEDHTH